MGQEGQTFGTIRRFGLHGPLYEIVGRSLERTGQMVRIRLIDSGEVVDYPRVDAMRDPIEA